MAIVSQALSPCTRCGKQHRVEIHKSINISENPELKEKVMDGSLFLWTCPDCGQTNLARYDTLYHDPVKKLMVWLVPGGDFPESQIEAINRHAKAMGGYVLRLCSDMAGFMEKVLLAENGLDDVVMEMCKYVTRMEMASKAGNREAAEKAVATPMHFSRLLDEGRTILLLCAMDGEMREMRLGWNVYEDCAGILSRNPSVRPDEGFAKVDAAFLAERLA